MPGRIRKSLRRVMRHWLFTSVLMVAAALSFRSAVADWNDVPTGSMQPSILIGDRIAVNKLAYDLHVPFTRTALARLGEPARGDIVTFWSPADGTRLVKRLIGLPGDVVEMRSGQLVINGVPVTYRPAPDPELRRAMGDEAGAKEFFVEELPGRPHLVAIEPAGGPRRSFGPVSVPQGQYLMLGDNRDHSADSRWFGFVPRANLCGRAFGVAFSLDHENHWLPRPDRWFRSLI